MHLRQFNFTDPVGLALGLPTIHNGNPIFAVVGAAVVLVPRVLPYAFAHNMLCRQKPFTVEDHGVKITSGGG